MLKNIVFCWCMAALVMLLLCSSPVSPAHENSVSQYQSAIYTDMGYFVDTEQDTESVTIRWPETVDAVTGIIQVRIHASSPWFDLFEFSKGIQAMWLYNAHMVRVMDPMYYFRGDNYQYRITLWEK